MGIDEQIEQIEQNVTRFFCLTPEQHSGYRGILYPDDTDLLGLDVLHNAVKVYEDAEKVIVYSILAKEQIYDICDIGEVGEENKLTFVALNALNILGRYCGTEYSSVPYYGLFWFFPELDYEIESTDDEGNTIMTPAVKRISWP